MAHILQLEIVIPYPLSKSSGNQQTDFKSLGYLPKAMLQVYWNWFQTWGLLDVFCVNFTFIKGL